MPDTDCARLGGASQVLLASGCNDCLFRHTHAHTHTHTHIGTCVHVHIPANIIEAYGLDLPIESALQKAECFRPLGWVDSERLFWWNPSWPPRVVETIRVKMAMCVGVAAVR